MRQIGGGIFSVLRSVALGTAFFAFSTVHASGLNEPNSFSLSESWMGTRNDGRWMVVGFAEAGVSGPDKAKGAVIYLHGRNSAQPGETQTSAPFLTFFAQKGWDVYKYNRRTGFDATKDDHLLRNNLHSKIQHLSNAGYKEIILAGVSRGGYLAIELADIPGVTGILSVAPGTNFWVGAPNETAKEDAELLFSGLRKISDRRVMMFFFPGDPRDEIVGGRAEQARRILEQNQVRNAVIDKPDNLRGHESASSERFARLFSECMWQFLSDVVSNTADIPCNTSAGYAVGGDINFPRGKFIDELEIKRRGPHARLIGYWQCTNPETAIIIKLAVTSSSDEKSYLVIGYSPAPSNALRERPWIQHAWGSTDRDGVLLRDKNRIIRFDGTTLRTKNAGASSWLEFPCEAREKLS